MGVFEKIISYFTSSYISSTQFQNSLLAPLRIFFERGNKIRANIAQLGNVFRNSKWVDMSVQNIKISFIRSTLSFYSLALLFLVIGALFGFVKGGNSETLFSWLQLWLPFGSIIVHQFVEAKQLLLEISQYWFAWVYGVFYSFGTALVAMSRGYLRGMAPKASILRPEPTTNTTAISWLTREQRTSNSVVYSPNFNNPTHRSSAWVNQAEILHSSYKLTNSTQLLPKPLPTSLSSKKLTALPSFKELPHYLTSATELNQSTYPELGYFTSTNLAYVPTQTTKPQLSSSVFSDKMFTRPTEDTYSITTNLNTLTRLSQFSAELNTSSLGVIDALNVAKQDRWLMKNSLLANKLDKHNNAYSQAKALTGTTVSDSSHAGTNVWFSSRFSAADAKTVDRFIAGTVHALYPSLNETNTDWFHISGALQPKLSNVNFFEESRTWQVVKYYQTSSLRHNNYWLAPLDLKPSPKGLFSYKLSNWLTAGHSLNLQNTTNSLYPITTIHTKPWTNYTGRSVSLVNGDLDLLKTQDLFLTSRITANPTPTGTLFYCSYVASHPYLWVQTVSKISK